MQIARFNRRCRGGARVPGHPDGPVPRLGEEAESVAPSWTRGDPGVMLWMAKKLFLILVFVAVVVGVAFYLRDDQSGSAEEPPVAPAPAERQAAAVPRVSPSEPAPGSGAVPPPPPPPRLPFEGMVPPPDIPRPDFGPWEDRVTREVGRYLDFFQTNGIDDSVAEAAIAAKLRGEDALRERVLTFPPPTPDELAKLEADQQKGLKDALGENYEAFEEYTKRIPDFEFVSEVAASAEAAGMPLSYEQAEALVTLLADADAPYQALPPLPPTLPLPPLGGGGVDAAGSAPPVPGSAAPAIEQMMESMREAQAQRTVEREAFRASAAEILTPEQLDVFDTLLENRSHLALPVPPIPAPGQMVPPISAPGEIPAAPPIAPPVPE